MLRGKASPEVKSPSCRHDSVTLRSLLTEDGGVRRGDIFRPCFKNRMKHRRMRHQAQEQCFQAGRITNPPGAREIFIGIGRPPPVLPVSKLTDLLAYRFTNLRVSLVTRLTNLPINPSPGLTSLMPACPGQEYMIQSPGIYAVRCGHHFPTAIEFQIVGEKECLGEAVKGAFCDSSKG